MDVTAGSVTTAGMPDYDLAHESRCAPGPGDIPVKHDGFAHGVYALQVTL